MRIVITGAAGNVGSMLHGDLLLDVHQGGYAANTDIEMVDITRDPLDFTGYDTVVHLAALTDTVESVAKPDEYSFTNYHGTIRVAEAAKKAGAHLVFPSTPPQVNGIAPDGIPMAGWVRYKGKNPYEQSKVDAEHYLTDNYPADSLTILRLGTVFGYSPGMKFQTVVNKFCKLASQKKPLTVWRTALHQLRPYLYIGDLVDTINAVVAGRITGVFNVQSTAASVGDIVEIIKERIPTVHVEVVDAPTQNDLSFELACTGLGRHGLDKHWTRGAVLRKGINEVLDVLLPREYVVGTPPNGLSYWTDGSWRHDFLGPTPPSQASVCDVVETDMPSLRKRRGYIGPVASQPDIGTKTDMPRILHFNDTPASMTDVRARIRAAFDACTNAEAPGLHKALEIIEEMSRG